MAISILRTDSVRSNSDTDDSFTPTRRAVLGGLAAAPLTVLPAAAAAYGCDSIDGRTDPMNMHAKFPTNPEADRTAWEEALTAYRDAQRTYDRYIEEVFYPADDVIYQRAGEEPDLSFVDPCDKYSERKRIRPTELDRFAEDEYWGPVVRPIRDKWRSYKRAFEDAKEAVGWEAIEVEQERLDKEVMDLEYAWLGTPAPDFSGFAAKVAQYCLAECAPAECRLQLRAEARLFAGENAA